MRIHRLRVSRFFFALLAMLFSAYISVCAAIGSSDSLDVEQAQAGAQISKQEARRLYVREHIVAKSDTINVLVTRVVDGDTFICVTCLTCDDSVRIRVLDLDTFEKARIPRLYKQAADWGITPEEALYAGKITTPLEAKKILEGKQVKLHRGNRREQNIDKYDRPLRYVILPDNQDYSVLMRSRGFNAKK